MRLSRRTNTIILWLISIGLLVGMIITFTPSMGNLFGGSATEGQTVLVVNGERITELDLARARQNPLYNAVTEGEVGNDLELLLTDQLIRETVFDQAAARTRVSAAEVREEVERFRQSAGVAGRANDRAYLNLIGQSGFDDQSFREYIESNLRRSKYQEALIEDVEVSDAEVETYYLANPELYQSEERVRARQIVVDDEELANELFERAVAGEDFAALASEFSLELADRGGALGAPAGSSEPEPVSRVAMPEAVAEAAFTTGASGVTEPVEVNGRWYIVKVEERIPQQLQPLEEVVEQVREDALAAKQSGVILSHIEELVAQANVERPEASELDAQDYPVAEVGDSRIMASDLALATYSNQQIQQSLTPELASLITDFFKPSVLEAMIDQKLAYLGSSELEGEFVGTESQVAQQALGFVSRDVEADEQALREYYESNQARYTTQAEALVTRVDFADQEAAEQFRAAVLSGEEVEAAAEATGGEVEEVGQVFEGDLEETLDRALFATDAFDPLPEGEREVSDVLVITSPTATEEEAEAEAEGEAAEDGSETGDAQVGQVTESYVVLVALRTPERTLPFEEVRDQVERAVLSALRAEAQEEWLAGLRQEYEVVNLLEQRRAEREQQATEALLTTEGAEGEGEATEEGVEATPSEDAASGDGAAPASEEAADDAAPVGDDAAGGDDTAPAGDPEDTTGEESAGEGEPAQ